MIFGRRHELFRRLRICQHTFTSTTLELTRYSCFGPERRRSKYQVTPCCMFFDVSPTHRFAYSDLDNPGYQEKGTMCDWARLRT